MLPSNNMQFSRGVGPTSAVIPAGDVEMLEEALDEAFDLYSEEPTVPYEIYLSAGEYLLPRTLVVFGRVEIYGAGMAATTLRQIGLPGTQAGNMNTMIKVPGMTSVLGASLKIDNVTIADGRTDDNGGAIDVQHAGATLTVTNTTFINNRIHTVIDTGGGDGGAIYNLGAVNLENVYFEGNSARRGGAIFNLSDSTNADGFAIKAKYVDFKNNESTHSSGGAVYSNDGDLKIRKSNFRKNFSTASGGVPKHAKGYSGTTANINAKNNYWNNPTIVSNANDNGVNTLNQLTAKVTFTLDPPRTPPPDPCSRDASRDVCVPQPTATPTAAMPSLTDFNIVLQGEWSHEERNEIQQAAYVTGMALAIHGVAPTPLEAFHEVLQGLNGSTNRSIRFYRSELDGPFCLTTKFTTGDESASIGCDPEVTITRHTAVHEFGHVFVGRTIIGSTSIYLAKTEFPGGAGVALTTSTGQFVIGPRSIPIQGRALDDWQRSDYVLDNGWGSAAQWNQTSYHIYPAPAVPAPTPTGFPVRIPVIGPCGEGAPTDLPPVFGTPFPYQQNPCTFSDEHATAPEGLISEIEEAAADMFINWVYWKIDPTASDRGFLDRRWRFASYSGGNCYPSGCSDGDFSGQTRQAWMDQIMTDLFAQFQW